MTEMPYEEVTIQGTYAAFLDGSATFVDVREPEEWAEGHLPGAIHIPLGELPRRLADVPRGLPIITICRSGYRSLTARKALLADGATDVRSLAGGMLAWHDAGYPVE